MNAFIKLCKDALPILLMLLCAAVLGILFLTGRLTMDDLLSLTQGHSRFLTIFILWALYALKGLTAVILFDALVLAAAALFPLSDAIFINCIGLLLCLSVSYSVGRFSKNRSMEHWLTKYPKLQRYFHNAADAGFFFCFFLHTLNLSLEAQGVLLGLLRVPFWKYLSGSFLAVVPGMLCFTIFGNAWNFQNPTFWIILALNICMIAGGVIYTKKRIFQ